MIIKYICSYCSKEFDTQEDCEAHEKTHDVSLWKNEDYAEWLRTASDEIKKQKKVIFGRNNQYITSALSYKVDDVATIFNNVAEILAPSKDDTKPTEPTDPTDEPTIPTEPTENPDIGGETKGDESSESGETSNTGGETTTEPTTDEGSGGTTESEVENGK